MKSLPKVIPPRSRVRLVRFDKRTPAWRKDVGREFRVGPYNRKDGLGCIWLVNEDGQYVQTTDREFLLVGCSSFRVDLGVIDPSRPGRFALGVECDGASYHSSATARDRDRIRQQMLEKLGWKIHRIWSPDWVTRHETEVNRLKVAIEASLKDRKENTRTGPSTVSNGPISMNDPIVIEKEIPRIDEKLVIPEWVEIYRVCKPRATQASGMQFHDPDALPILKRMLTQIVEAEGPPHKDVAANEPCRASPCAAKPSRQ